MSAWSVWLAGEEPTTEEQSGGVVPGSRGRPTTHSGSCMQSGSVRRELGTERMVELCGWSGEIDRGPWKDVGRSKRLDRYSSLKLQLLGACWRTCVLTIDQSKLLVTCWTS